jgi:hypothetical protein
VSYEDGELCPNCGSGSHARCGAWCAAVHSETRLGREHCSGKCSTAQRRADAVSARMEQGFVAPRLDTATRAGLGHMRSLADIEATNGIDLSPEDTHKLRLAIAWLDHQLDKGTKR